MTVQESGQCHCKPNVCSGTCSTCKDGFYNLKDHDYFGCQGERSSEQRSATAGRLWCFTLTLFFFRLPV